MPGATIEALKKLERRCGMRIVSWLLLSAVLLAQEPPLVRTSMRLVQVNVVVTGTDGEPVKDLIN